MRIRLTIAYVALHLAAFAFGAAAGTFRIPNDEAVAHIEIPDDWQTRQEEEFVEAATPDGAFHLMLLAPEGRKVGESIGEAVRYIRRNGNITIKPGSMKREISDFKGRQMIINTWDGYDSGQPMVLRTYVVPLADRESFLVMAWGSPTGHEKYVKAVETVLKSIAPAQHHSERAEPGPH